MRERNNEASKRCRLKRRIKQVTIVMIVMVMKRRRNKKEKREITFWNWFQDSLDKTKILLESHREALSHRFPFIFFSFAQNLFHILQQQNWFSSIFSGWRSCTRSRTSSTMPAEAWGRWSQLNLFLQKLIVLKIFSPGWQPVQLSQRVQPHQGFK